MGETFLSPLKLVTASFPALHFWNLIEHEFQAIPIVFSGKKQVFGTLCILK